METSAAWSLDLKKEALWVSVTNDGFEHVDIDGPRIDGVIVRREEGSTYRARYRMELDSRRHVRMLAIERLGVPEKTLVLSSDGNGAWFDREDREVAALCGCIDVDIAASPFTNSLSIWRLALADGVSHELSVAYARPDTLTIASFRQKYTHLGFRDGKDRWLYESLEGSAFRAELPVDSDGLCLEYPGFFHRLW